MAFPNSWSPSNGSLLNNNPRPTAVVVCTADTGNSYEFMWTEIHVSKTSNTPAGLSFNQPGTVSWQISNIGIPVGSSGTINMPYPSNATSLSSGQYYGRFLLLSRADYEINYQKRYESPVFTFNVIQYPTATPTSPVGGAFQEATSSIIFNWSYTSADPNDYMTAYQIEIREGTNLNPTAGNTTLVTDTGKVSVLRQMGSSRSAVVTVDPAISTKTLWWRVRAWDYNNSASNWSSLQSFDLIARPSLTITSPTEAQAVNTGSPTFTINPTIAENGTAQSVVTSIILNGEEVWRKTTTTNALSGTPINVSDAALSLKNNTSYILQASLVDNRGLQSVNVSRNFSTSFTLPPTPTGNVAVTVSAIDTSGYVEVAWDGSARDADFLAWQVERREYMVNPDNGAEESVSDWQVIGRSYLTNAAVTFRDYLAPLNHTPEYRIKQIALRFGAELVSTNGITGKGSWLNKLSYWLVGGDNGSSANVAAIRLYNVTADDFSDEQEQAEYNLMGRGRYVEHGDRLGVRGQLTLKLRNSDGIMARQKRKTLESFKLAYVSAYLRNPYGDVYKVSVGNMSISRLAGVGSSEFCDVTIPYAEVVS